MTATVHTAARSVAPATVLPVPTIVDSRVEEAMALVAEQVVAFARSSGHD